MNRRTKYGLPIEQVLLLLHKSENSPVMNQLVEIGTKALEKEQQHIEKAKKKLNKIIKKKDEIETENNAIYEKINSDILIADLVCEHT